PRARAAGFGEPSAPLEDDELDLGARRRRKEADVRALRKLRMMLERRPEAERFLAEHWPFGRLIQRTEDKVRVPHRDPHPAASFAVRSRVRVFEEDLGLPERHPHASIREDLALADPGVGVDGDGAPARQGADDAAKAV